MTLLELLEELANSLEQSDCYYGHGTDNPQDEALYIAVETLNLDYASVHQYFDQTIDEGLRLEAEKIVRQRIESRLPAAYLLGKAYFAGLCFKIDERALVPRSPIAELIHRKFSPWLASSQLAQELPLQILDMCTGSGCIGIAAGLAIPNSRVTLCDLSADALALANENIAVHELAERCLVKLGNGLEAVADDRSSPCYDLVLCNPPYVDNEDLAMMPAEYHHEPALGLGSGKDGLDFTRQFLLQLPQYIHDDTVIVLELGNTQEAFFEQFAHLHCVQAELENGGHGVLIIMGEDLCSFIQKR